MDRPTGSDSPATTLAALAAAMLTANLVLPVLILSFPREAYYRHLVLLGAGGLLGEACLLAVWAAWSWPPLHIRLTLSATALAALWYAWILGLKFADPLLSFGPAMIAGCCGGATFAVATATLLAARRFARRAMVHPAQPPAGAGRLRYGVKSLLLWTALTGLLLTLGRLVLPHGSTEQIRPAVSSLAALSLLAAGFATTIACLCIWSALSDAPLAARLLAAALGLLAWPAVCSVPTFWLAAHDSSSPEGDFSSLVSLGAGVALMVLGGMLTLRLSGFRLARISHESTVGAGDSPRDPPA